MRCEDPQTAFVWGQLVSVVLCVQVLFACAEALHAHGYSNEACRLAVELARDLLANPPDLKVEQPQTKVDTIIWNIFSSRCVGQSVRNVKWDILMCVLCGTVAMLIHK